MGLLDIEILTTDTVELRIEYWSIMIVDPIISATLSLGTATAEPATYSYMEKGMNVVMYTDHTVSLACGTNVRNREESKWCESLVDKALTKVWSVKTKQNSLIGCQLFKFTIKQAFGSFT